MIPFIVLQLTMFTNLGMNYMSLQVLYHAWLVTMILFIVF